MLTPCPIIPRWLRLTAIALTICPLFHDGNAEAQDGSAPSGVTTKTQLPALLAGPTAEPKRVGRKVCGECHRENFQLHAQHGHAHTFARVEELDIAERFHGKTFDGGAAYGTYHYQRDDMGRLSVRLPEKFGDEPFPLQFALGSGHNAITFLTLLPQQTGGTGAVEHRVSWYSADDKLGITPGHGGKIPRGGVDLIGDVHGGQPLDRCIYCHTTSAQIVNLEIADLVPNVNCEKCHGPGSEHVRQARQSPNPPPYSVGREDWDAESEVQLCGDCHRLPRAVTQRELRDYPDLLARFQPVGMLRSKCFIESEGKLRCTTCHNPHQSITQSTPATQVAHCVACHQENHDEHVACPVSPTENCIECHMPALKSELLQFHDHWIRVRD